MSTTRRTAVARTAMCPYCGKRVAIRSGATSIPCSVCQLPGVVIRDSHGEAAAVEWTIAPDREGP